MIMIDPGCMVKHSTGLWRNATAGAWCCR